MGLEAARADRDAQRADAAQQAGIANDQGQQRINADNNRVGLENANAMARNKAITDQNTLTNNRQATADRNTLDQQNLTNTRNATEDAQKAVVWNRANDFTAKTQDLANIWENTLKMKPDDQGFYDLNHSATSVNAQVYNTLPKDADIQGKLNNAGGMDIYTNGAPHLIGGKHSISLPVEGMKTAYDIFSNGGKEPKADNVDIKTDPTTGEITGWDKKGNQVKLNTLADQELAALDKTKSKTNSATQATDTQQPTTQDNAGLGNSMRRWTDNNGGVHLGNTSASDAPLLKELTSPRISDGLSSAIQAAPTTQTSPVVSNPVPNGVNLTQQGWDSLSEREQKAYFDQLDRTARGQSFSNGLGSIRDGINNQARSINNAATANRIRLNQ